MRIITIKSYEMCRLSRWGWHTFRDRKGNVIGFRFMGIGLAWNKRKWTCDRCGHVEHKEVEVMCWQCGKGEMVYSPNSVISDSLAKTKNANAVDKTT